MRSPDSMSGSDGGRREADDAMQRCEIRPKSAQEAAGPAPRVQPQVGESGDRDPLIVALATILKEVTAMTVARKHPGTEGADPQTMRDVSQEILEAAFPPLDVPSSIPSGRTPPRRPSRSEAKMVVTPVGLPL